MLIKLCSANKVYHMNKTVILCKYQ